MCLELQCSVKELNAKLRSDVRPVISPLGSPEFPDDCAPSKILYIEL